MTLTELRYVVAIAKERHFGRAANLCNVSQPALSIAIKKLEQKLGIVLFERASYDVIITQPGQKIVEQAKIILQKVEELKIISDSFKNQLDTPLRLGVISTVSPYLLAQLIPNLKALAPNMPLYIEENYTEVLLNRLKFSDIDAVVASRPIDDNGKKIIDLYDEKFVVATPKNHFLKQENQKISVQKLLNNTLLLLSQGNCFREQVLQLLEKYSNSKENLIQNRNFDTFQGTSLTTIRHMVASGLGITVLPSSSINYEPPKDIEILEFEDPVPVRRIVLITRQQFPRQRAIQYLVKAIRQTNLIGTIFVDQDI